MPRHVAIICHQLNTADPVAQTSLDLAVDLIHEGYRVSLLTPGPVDVDVDERIEVLTFDAGARLQWLWILRFRRWVAKTLAGLGADRTISLTTVMAADILVSMQGLVQAEMDSRLLYAEGTYARLVKRLAYLLPSNWLSRHLEHRSLSHETLRAVVALSPQVADSLSRAKVNPGAAIELAHLPITPMCVDEAESCKNRQKLARALGLDPDAYWVVFPFTRSGVEGLEPLLRAFKPCVGQGVDAVLLLAGPTRYTHLAWVAELGLRDRVRFVGWTARPEVLLPCSDVVVYPVSYDPVGWGVRAALAAGKPIIATTASGLADMVQEQGGTVLDSPTQPQALLRAIRAHHAAWQGGEPAQTASGAATTPQNPTLGQAVKALLADPA